MLTLGALVRHPGLRLGVLAGDGRLGAGVRWAQTSELSDPGPWLDGGELLLTTGMKLDVDDPDAMRRYVEGLTGAGVVALGFGVGVTHDSVPKSLVEAAADGGLPLLEVPRTTPFIAISKAVSAAVAADRYQAVTAGFEAQRDLTRAALADGGQSTVVARLAAHLGGWAALYDTSGALIAAAPEWAAGRARALRPDVERLRDRPAPASAVVAGGPDGADGSGGPEQGAGDRVELQSLGSGRRSCGVLAVGTDTALDTVARYAVHAAVALLTLTTERSLSFQAAEQRLGTAVLRLLLSGHPEHARAVAGPLYGGLLDAPVRLMAAEAAEPQDGQDAALTEFADALETVALTSGEPVLVVPDGGRLLVLAADAGAVARAAEEHAAVVEDRYPGSVGPPGGSRPAAARTPLPLTVGVSAPAGPAAVPAAYKQAEQAVSVARRRGRVLVEHEDLAAGSVLPLLADDAVQAFADGLLRALREHDATGRGDLVESLRAWLSRHGQWDAAAADLGVHRHTLRYRMRRVEEILGRSLDDPDARMELWLALKASAVGP
ncbi:Purine catabolism regulatory protein [Streptomyces sp. RB5]|uniref:Purine catabolism regulatory protein n=1 Tax=Streptomyces smaragdinus TaxID=2585196 RepID=A0A7K0CTD1_9ACTN|nr:PucR family transcriptional regulator [Streptomyces smaragdinus]MQY15984.1 Purine catabolism regulatory protein [Streptomyces smaragdinus]